MIPSPPSIPHHKDDRRNQLTDEEKQELKLQRSKDEIDQQIYVQVTAMRIIEETNRKTTTDNKKNELESKFQKPNISKSERVTYAALSREERNQFMKSKFNEVGIKYENDSPSKYKILDVIKFKKKVDGRNTLGSVVHVDDDNIYDVNLQVETDREILDVNVKEDVDDLRKRFHIDENIKKRISSDGTKFVDVQISKMDVENNKLYYKYDGKELSSSPLELYVDQLKYIQYLKRIKIEEKKKQFLSGDFLESTTIYNYGEFTFVTFIDDTDDAEVLDKEGNKSSIGVLHLELVYRIQLKDRVEYKGIDWYVVDSIQTDETRFLDLDSDNTDITGRSSIERVPAFNVKYKPFEVGEKVTFMKRDERTFLSYWSLFASTYHSYSGEIVEILEDKKIKIRYKEHDQENSIEITLNPYDSNVKQRKE